MGLERDPSVSTTLAYSCREGKMALLGEESYLGTDKIALIRIIKTDS